MGRDNDPEGSQTPPTDDLTFEDAIAEQEGAVPDQAAPTGRASRDQAK